MMEQAIFYLSKIIGIATIIHASADLIYLTFDQILNKLHRLTSRHPESTISRPRLSIII
jgi:hypothetical protein